MVKRLKSYCEELTPRQYIWLLLGVWWIVNLLQASFTELANDEAYYFMFSRNLDWGYFDHPPMTALLVWLSSFAGGELGVRFFFTLLQPLYIYVLWWIIAPADYSKRDVTAYVLICAAMPILQLYGFIAVPDGPLMLFTALFLWCYKRFTESGKWSIVLLLGLCMGALAYSKYHGALVVLFTVLSNLRLLKSVKFYASCLVAVIVIIPHLRWQYQHDWISFAYHLMGRNRDFEFAFVSEYILNLFAIFNPFLFPVVVVAWWKTKSETPVMRAMSAIAAGFILFFLATTLRGYVQPQWEIPATFGIIALLFKYSGERERLRRYIVKVGWITLALMALVRIEMIFNPIGLRFEIFNNKTSYSQIAEAAQGRPVIFDGSYTAAAKYEFYTGGSTYAQPTVYYRTSQYELMDDDTAMAGHSVVVENGGKDCDSVNLANGNTFNYKIIDDFIPLRKIMVTGYDMPETVKRGDKISLDVKLTNPYPYQYDFGNDTILLNFVWRGVDDPIVVPVRDFSGVLPPNGTLDGMITVDVPSELKNREYQVGFTITNSIVATWFNSKQGKVKVTE